MSGCTSAIVRATAPGSSSRNAPSQRGQRVAGVERPARAGLGRLDLLAVEGDRPVARRGAVLLVETGQERVVGGLVDLHLGVEGLAAGEVVPEADRVPALLAPGLGDRGPVVDREAGLRRGRRPPARRPRSSRCRARPGRRARRGAARRPRPGGAHRCGHRRRSCCAGPCRRRRSARRRRARRTAPRARGAATARPWRPPSRGAERHWSGSSARGESRRADPELPDRRRAPAPSPRAYDVAPRRSPRRPPGAPRSRPGTTTRPRPR